MGSREPSPKPPRVGTTIHRLMIVVVKLKTFCQLENVTYSRPIGTVSEDPKDETIITPELCSRGKSDLLPSRSITTPANLADCSPTKQWTYIQNLLHGFKKRWSKEYVSSLQARGKWKTERKNLKLREIVYVTDENATPLHWSIGRIVHLYSGLANFVRVVKTTTATGTYYRSP